MNLNIDYYTPEEYFLGDAPAKYTLTEFNPFEYILNQSASEIDIPVSDSPDVVLFVGPPGAGKSTLFREWFLPREYKRVNQDTLKTRDRCISEATRLLKEGVPLVIGTPSVVVIEIDNTNADKATRKIWLDLARGDNREIRCVAFTA